MVSEEKPHRDRFPPAEVVVSTLFTVVQMSLVSHEPYICVCVCVCVCVVYVCVWCISVCVQHASEYEDECTHMHISHKLPCTHMFLSHNIHPCHAHAQNIITFPPKAPPTPPKLLPLHTTVPSPSHQRSSHQHIHSAAHRGI